MNNNSLWQKYYDGLTKTRVIEKANHINAEWMVCIKEEVNWGEVVYRSPEALILMREQLFKVDWLVMRFVCENKKIEYNVFLEKTIYQQVCRGLVESFVTEESAKKFALEMFLVCRGYLKRHDLSKWI